MSLDIRRSVAASAVAVAAIGTGAGCGGSKDDDDKKKAAPKPPAGIITDQTARAVRLNITQAQFRRRVKLEPVATDTERAKRSEEKAKEYTPELLRKLEKRYGVKPKNGIVVLPARSYSCLFYRGERPQVYGWKFCFGDDTKRLDYVSTTGPVEPTT